LLQYHGAVYNSESLVQIAKPAAATPGSGRGGSPYLLGTVDRAATLLRLLADLDKPVTFTELVEAMGLNKATVYRLVQTLLSSGFLRQAPGGGYTLGPALITLGQAALRETGLPEVAQPHMERLHERLQEVVVLSVLDGQEIVYVARLHASQILSIRGNVGDRLPAYCTSAGQAMLAGLDDEEVRALVVDLPPAGPKAPSSMKQLLRKLADTRARGYAINDEELAVGHRAAAAPVLDHSNSVVAALSLSVPAARVSRDQVETFAVNALVPTAKQLSVDLGASVSGDLRFAAYSHVQRAA
jgi:IclR family pca regulon transcriptional regulator